MWDIGFFILITISVAAGHRYFCPDYRPQRILDMEKVSLRAYIKRRINQYEKSKCKLDEFIIKLQTLSAFHLTLGTEKL